MAKSKVFCFLKFSCHIRETIRSCLKLLSSVALAPIRLKLFPNTAGIVKMRNIGRVLIIVCVSFFDDW